MLVGNFLTTELEGVVGASSYKPPQTWKLGIWWGGRGEREVYRRGNGLEGLVRLPGADGSYAMVKDSCPRYVS